MVVTGEGTADEVKQYQDVIDMVFAELDTVQSRQVLSTAHLLVRPCH